MNILKQLRILKKDENLNIEAITFVASFVLFALSNDKSISSAFIVVITGALFAFSSYKDKGAKSELDEDKQKAFEELKRRVDFLGDKLDALTFRQNR